MTREYSRLAQNERDLESTNYTVKPAEPQRKRSCCFSTFVVFSVIVMLCGGVAIVVGIFFTPQVNNIIDTYWKPTNSSSISSAKNTTVLVNKTQEVVTTTIIPLPVEPPLMQQNATQKEISRPENNTVPGTSSTSTEIDENSDDEDDDDDDDESTTQHSLMHQDKNHTASTNGTKEHGFLFKLTGDDKFIDETEEEFATGMIKLERFLEKITGIRRPEFVVPIFMLICFIISLTLASCCCYLVMKKRESKRRRTIGRLITDLQSGDSKAVLLDQDGDD